MNGPQHYSYAEQLLDMAGDYELGSEHERYALAKAQVHATLALAAATALDPRAGAGGFGTDGQPTLWKQWTGVAMLRVTATEEVIEAEVLPS